MSNIIELRKKRKKRKNNNIGKYLLFVCFVLILIALIGLRFFKIDQYEIEGNRLYSNEQILEILNINKGTNIIHVYRNANKNLSQFTFIEDIKVEYKSYNKIKILVEEKQVIGYIFYMSKYLCIDKDGFIIDYVEPDQLDDKIPIIEGLSSDTLVLGERINSSQNLIELCYFFYKAEIKYDLKIDKLTFKDNNSEEILIKINKTTIDFGNKNSFNEKIQIMKEILERVPQDESGTLYLGNDGSKSYYEKNLE